MSAYPETLVQVVYKGSKPTLKLHAMRFKSLPWWLWLIPIALLFIATQRMPYGYYTFTRIAVCGLSGFFAVVAWRERSKVWAGLFVLVAILFNPIIPIYLGRATWSYLDISIAVIFLAHLAVVRLEWLRTKGS